MTHFPLRFQNKAAEEVPGFAVMFVSAIVRGTSNQIVYQIKKPALPPDIVGEKLVLINSAQPIAVDGYGWARYASDPGPVLYTGTEPTFGTMYGVADASWALNEDAPGFVVLGLSDTTNHLTYAKLLSSIKFHGVTTGSLVPASDGQTGATSGTATGWIEDSGTGDLADGPSIVVVNRSIDSTINSGTYIQAEWSWRYLEWMITWADC